MRPVWAIVACFGLGGCVMPPVVSYGSLAMDGVSYAATGKSVSDHALSAATEQDCAMWRVVSEQQIDAVCQKPGATVVAEDGDDGGAWSFIAGLFSGDDKTPTGGLVDDVIESPATGFGDIDPAKIRATPVVTPVAVTAPVVEPVVVEPLVNIPLVDMPPAAATANRKAIYLVLGSFATVDRAENLASRVPGVTTAIAPALVGEERYFRLVAGPFEANETGDAEQRLTAAGINNVWAARLCTNDLMAPPCKTAAP